MNVATDVVRDTIIVHVSGEVDMSNTHVIEGTVSTEVPNDAYGVVLDLSDVTYLDSAGIRLLYHLESRLSMHQQRFVVAVPAGSVLIRTLQAAGVIGSLRLAATVDVGLAMVHAEEQRADRGNG